MSRYPESMEEAGLPPQCMFRQNRVSESRLHQPLYRFGIVGFHEHSRCYLNFLEEAVDNQAHVASFWIQQERSFPEFGYRDRAHTPPAHAACRWTHHQQFLVKKRCNCQIHVWNWEGDQRQVETPLV